MTHKKHIRYTEVEKDIIRKYIAYTPNGRAVKLGYKYGGMASVVARHGKRSVEQKVAVMRQETPLHKLAREMQPKPKGKTVFEHRFCTFNNGVWFLLGMVFAFSIALLI